MATYSHESGRVPEKRRWAEVLQLRDMWVSIAITVMWMTVLLDALWGPDFKSASSTASGATTTTIPSAVFLGLFAWFATYVVAKYGFGKRDKGDA